MFPKTIDLQKEIQKLDNHLQAADVIDGYFHSAHKILMTFTEQDWERLKMDLKKWEDKELRTLALALKDGDGFGNVLYDDYFYGYIFSAIDIGYADHLTDGLVSFFDDKIVSVELLGAIKSKIEELKVKGYIREHYDYLIKAIEDMKNKTST